MKKILNTEKKDTSCNRLIEGKKKNVLSNAVLKSQKLKVVQQKMNMMG